MKGKKHSPEQIIKKLSEADAMIATGKTIGLRRSFGTRWAARVKPAILQLLMRTSLSKRL